MLCEILFDPKIWIGRLKLIGMAETGGFLDFTTNITFKLLMQS